MVLRHKITHSFRRVAAAGDYGPAIWVLALLAVAFVAHGLFWAPALFMDDWTSVIERVVTGNARWFDPQMRRPLLFIPFLLQHAALGVNVPAYYALLWLLYIVMAVQVGYLADQFSVPGDRVFGAVVALLFVVYPTNFTHMWLIMLGVYVATILTLFYAIFWLKLARSGRWRDCLIACCCLLIPLGLYEGQLGVAAAWAVIVFFLGSTAPWRPRPLLLLPIALLGGFALWRTLGFQSTGVTDPYLAQIVTAPADLASRLLLGYKVSLLWGWTYAVAQIWPAAGGTIPALTLIGAAVAGLLVIGRFALPAGPLKVANRFPQRTDNLKRYAVIAAAGVALVGAGYLPTITVFLPNLSGIGSRFNLFASIGGAVAMAAFLKMGAILIGRSTRQQNLLLASAALPLIVLGIVLHTTVQRTNRQAWVEQRLIWQQLFEKAPQLTDDTLVLFVLPGFEERTGFQNLRRTPLSASWEASSSVRLLYDNFSLSGDVVFPDIDEPIEPRLTAAGIVSTETGKVTPYDQVVAYTFDVHTGALTQMTTLPAAWITGTAAPVTLCQTCVRFDPPPEVPLRRLIQ